MKTDLLEGLNNEQKQAVTFGAGPLLIVAGAGTGKTTVITRRIAWLIEQKLATPESLLALTFTDKAAGEMEERVDKLLPYGYTDLWISTFHSFCERILKQHALDVGVPYDFKLLTSTEQWMLVRKFLDKFTLSYYRPLGNPTKFIHALIRHFSRAKDEGVTPEGYLRYAESKQLDSDVLSTGKAKRKKTKKEASRGDTLTRQGDALAVDANEAARLQEIANAYHTYQQLLLENIALDFGDLIAYTLRLFQTRPEVLKTYQDQFRYIMIDEFQDTNTAQYELIKLLAGSKSNLTVVGDDDQSIYRFRGASMSNILLFQKDHPMAEQVVLTNNYRSAQNILDLSYRFIQHNNPNRLEVQLANGAQPLSKALKSSAKTFGTIEHLHGETLADEQQLVVDRILALKAADSNMPWSDIAILARSNDTVSSFDSALERAGIPHQSVSTKGLYLRPAIIDALSYFRVLCSVHNSQAMWRVLTWPEWQLPTRELLNLSHWANRKSKSLVEAMEQAASIEGLSSTTTETLARMVILLADHASFAIEHKPTELLVRMLHDNGYIVWVESLGEEKARQIFAELNQLYKRIKRWEDSTNTPRLKELLEAITLEIESGEEGDIAIDTERGPDVVKLMTVHAAKGLEFANVFLVGLVDRRFPTDERKDPIELPTDLVKEIVPEGNIHLEEERRLFYVAMTRAKRGLFFTSAEDYGGTRRKKPSRFLNELGITLTEARHLEQPAFGKVISLSTLEEEPIMPDYVPDHFSFTALKAYEVCPFQYRFAHILKVPVWGRYAMSFGQTMHLALEHFFTLVNERDEQKQESLFGDDKISQSTIPSLKELLKMYDESWIDDWYESREHAEEYRAKGRTMLTEFYQSFAGKWPKVKAIERGFTLQVGEYKLKGKIDRIDEVDRGVELVDYKTGRVPKPNEVDKDQLLIYQIAAEQVLGEKPVNLTYYYLDGNKPITFLGTPEELAELQVKVINTIEKIKKGKFAATPSQQACKFCDFKDICEFREI